MKVWRCASARPGGGRCLHGVGARAQWHPAEQCWLGELCDRCWREHLDAHPGRIYEIAGDPNTPASVLRVLARLNDPRLDAVIARRGDRLPDDLRQILLQSADADVRESAAVGDRVPLEPAWWLYRTTPTPRTRRALLAGGVAAAALLVVLTLALQTATEPDTETPTTDATPTTTRQPSTTIADSTSTTTALPAPAGTSGSTGDPVVQFQEFDVVGEEGATCIVFITVTGVDSFRLYSPDFTVYDAQGNHAATGPPGTWEISYIAPPTITVTPVVETEGCP